LRKQTVIDAGQIDRTLIRHSMHADRNIRWALGAAVALCAFAALPVLVAQDGVQPNPPAAAPPANPDPTATGELARLGAFLDQHPFIEARLRENPTLADNPAFQRNHPLFAQFLARHPGISAELAARPRWFLHRELVRQSATPITRPQLAEFDRFLDQHPRMERMLVLHPRLLRQPEFLNNNPELREYLKRNPGKDRDSESKPERPMKGERRN
jgi:hypothetical protein